MQSPLTTRLFIALSLLITITLWCQRINSAGCLGCVRVILKDQRLIVVWGHIIMRLILVMWRVHILSGLISMMSTWCFSPCAISTWDLRIPLLCCCYLSKWCFIAAKSVISCSYTAFLSTLLALVRNCLFLRPKVRSVPEVRFTRRRKCSLLRFRVRHRLI